MTPWIKQSLVGLCGAALIAAAATVVADRDRGHPGEGAHGCNAGWMHDDKARAEHRAKRVEQISTELGLTRRSRSCRPSSKSSPSSARP